jgi:hypothetical protein
MLSITLVGSNARRPSIRCAGHGDLGYLQGSQLDQRPVCWPQGGDVVCRIAPASQFQEYEECDRTIPRAVLQLLAQEVRAAGARDIRGEAGFPGLGYPAITAESAGTSGLRGFEAEHALVAMDPWCTPAA